MKVLVSERKGRGNAGVTVRRIAKGVDTVDESVTMLLLKAGIVDT